MQNQQNRKKILLTGAHAGSSAVAVAIQIKKRKKPWQLSWIGPAKAYQDKKLKPYESAEMEKLGVENFSIDSSKAQRTSSMSTIKFLLKLPWGFIQALRIVDQLRPDVILSFGGYVAFPVVIIGKLLGAKVIIHEQVVTVGIANRFTKYFADVIALGWKQSAKHFPKKKSVYVGLPIREEILAVKPKSKPGMPKTLFIMGGSRGSVPINDLTLPILDSLLTDYNLIHAAGKLDIDRFEERRSKLAGARKKRYRLYSFLDAKEMADAYERSDIIVSRSGAHNVNEILFTKRPSILIPLPLTNNREQDKNAEMARKYGVAKVCQQSELTPAILLDEITSISKNWQKIRDNIRKGELVQKDAVEKLVEMIKEKLP